MIGKKMSPNRRIPSISRIEARNGVKLLAWSTGLDTHVTIVKRSIITSILTTMTERHKVRYMGLQIVTLANCAWNNNVGNGSYSVSVMISPFSAKKIAGNFESAFKKLNSDF